MLTKLETLSVGEELKAVFREIDQHYKGKRRPIEKELLEDIQAFRKERRSAKVA